MTLAVGTTYLLRNASKRAYVLCAFIPFVLVLITTVAASVGRILEWWGQIAQGTGDQAFLLKLASVLAVIMLALTATIAVDAVRRWIGILRETPGRGLAGVAAGTTKS